MMRRKFWIASAGAVVVVMAGLLVYGSYISAQYQMEALQTALHEQWVQLDGAIQRRARLVPQLVAAMQPVAKQNKAALEKLESARQGVLQAHKPEAVMAAGRALDEAMTMVEAIVQNHPELQSDAKVQALQARLRTTAHRMEQNRRRYNESLRNYNVFLSEFPNNMWAKVAGFRPDHRFYSVSGPGS